MIMIDNVMVNGVNDKATVKIIAYGTNQDRIKYIAHFKQDGTIKCYRAGRFCREGFIPQVMDTIYTEYIKFCKEYGQVYRKLFPADDGFQYV